MSDLVSVTTESVGLTESFSINFVASSGIAGHLILTSTLEQDFDLAWNISTKNKAEEFGGYLQQFKTYEGSFSAKLCHIRTDVPGVVGHSLAGALGTPIGFYPYNAVSGVVVNQPMDVSMEIAVEDADVPGSISWSITPTENILGGTGRVEWVRARIAYLSDRTYREPSEKSVSQKLFLRNAPSGDKGIFGNTEIVEHSGVFEGEFSGLGSGIYQFIAEVKQSANPTPYVQTSGFTIGGTPPYEITASGIPQSGLREMSVDFTSDIITGTEEDVELIHWDVGGAIITGNNNEIIKNPSHTYIRPGFYNPIVTYVMKDGYIVSKALDKAYP